MATIVKRGPLQYCARIRRKGISISKTFRDRETACRWARIKEAEIDKNQFILEDEIGKLTLAELMLWYKTNILPLKPKSIRAKKPSINYWLKHDLSKMRLTQLTKERMIEWRNETLDELEPDPEMRRPECSAQTVVHRMNLISHAYNELSQRKDLQGLINPITKGVRPVLRNDRKRRLKRASEEEITIYEACQKNPLHP